MNKEPPYVSDLYDTLENLKHKVENHCPVIPECVQSCLELANFVLLRVQRERKKNDITD